MTFDAIGAVEACYAGGDDVAWLGGLLASLATLGPTSGSFAQIFRLSPTGPRIIEAETTSGAFPPATLHLMNQENDRFALVAPNDVVRRLWATRPAVDYAMRRAIRAGPPLLEHQRSLVQRLGGEDTLGIFAGEPDGSTVLLARGVPRGGTRVSARTWQQLTRLSAHLRSGLRLRRALLDPGADGSHEDPDAVLDPAGKVLEAGGLARGRDSRRSLTDAVRRQERARGSLRRTDPEEALRLWQGLVDGTWSLVDRCESDGRRYVLARRNDGGVRDPMALTGQQRSVLALAAAGRQNKLIGYLLGLSPSAVASHLSTALRKLGLASRADLIRWFGPVVSSAQGRASDLAPRRPAVEDGG